MLEVVNGFQLKGKLCHDLWVSIRLCYYDRLKAIVLSFWASNDRLLNNEHEIVRPTKEKCGNSVDLHGRTEFRLCGVKIQVRS